MHFHRCQEILAAIKRNKLQSFERSNLHQIVVYYEQRNTKGFGSVQSLDQLGCRGDIGDDSEEILFLSFLQENLVSSSSIGRDVHSLMLSGGQMENLGRNVTTEGGACSSEP